MMKNGVPIVFAMLIAAAFGGLMYLQFAIIRDCGWMAFFHGAEWWWLFGYC